MYMLHDIYLHYWCLELRLVGKSSSVMDVYIIVLHINIMYSHLSHQLQLIVRRPPDLRKR